MPLPFKHQNPHLHNNKSLALHRLNQLKRRLKSDSNYATGYAIFMQDIIEKGYAEKIPDNESHPQEGSINYIPHHGVYHPKKPGKLRVVFDCSAKFKGESLNDKLLTGPNLTNALVGVGILSTVSSVYDPLGFVAPVILVGKQILQQMCADGHGWDSPLPDELRSRWQHWRTELFALENLRIRRCFKPSEFGEVKSVELHYFSDASTNGYGQCTYLHLKNDEQQVHCALVMGKARVVPLKPTTVPHLELTAALLSVKISTLLRKVLEYDNVTETFWTDSQVVLGYINNEARSFQVFVANRVQQIRSQYRKESDPSAPRLRTHF